MINNFVSICNIDDQIDNNIELCKDHFDIVNIMIDFHNLDTSPEDFAKILLKKKKEMESTIESLV